MLGLTSFVVDGIKDKYPTSWPKLRPADQMFRTTTGNNTQYFTDNIRKLKYYFLYVPSF